MLAGVANSVTSVSLMGSCKPTEWNSSSVRWGGGKLSFYSPSTVATNVLCNDASSKILVKRAMHKTYLEFTPC